MACTVNFHQHRRVVRLQQALRTAEYGSLQSFDINLDETNVSQFIAVQCSYFYTSRFVAAFRAIVPA